MYGSGPGRVPIARPAEGGSFLAKVSTSRGAPPATLREECSDQIGGAGGYVRSSPTKK